MTSGGSRPVSPTVATAIVSAVVVALLVAGYFLFLKPPTNSGPVKLHSPNRKPPPPPPVFKS